MEEEKEEEKEEEEEEEGEVTLTSPAYLVWSVSTA